MTPDDVIRHLATTPRLLVALDFDGTLAPLQDDPMAARMTDDARRAVAALVAAPDTRVALVSGRGLHDLRIIAEHDDDSPLLLAGSHGAEHWPGEAEDAPDDDLRDRLEARARDAVAPFEGAWVEPKRFGFAVHTRLVTPAAEAAVFAAADAVVDAGAGAEAEGWRRRTGRNIVEYASRAEGKDTAVAHLRALTSATAVLFAGDDVTDEDALRSLAPGDVGVRVGPGESAATVRVDGIADLAAMLVRVAQERSRARE